MRNELRKILYHTIYSMIEFEMVLGKKIPNKDELVQEMAYPRPPKYSLVDEDLCEWLDSHTSEWHVIAEPHLTNRILNGTAHYNVERMGQLFKINAMSDVVNLYQKYGVFSAVDVFLEFDKAGDAIMFKLSWS